MAQVTKNIETVQKVTGLTVEMSLEEAENLSELLNGHVSAVTTETMHLESLRKALGHTVGTSRRVQNKFVRDASFGITVVRPRP